MATKRTYKRLDVRAIYTDEKGAVYLKLANGRVVRIKRVNENYSSALVEDHLATTGDRHEVSPDEIMSHDSIAF